MKFGTFTSTSSRVREEEPSSVSSRKPWTSVAGDRLGIDYAWEVEHHFPRGVLALVGAGGVLAAASQRSKRIRLGHGIVLMPPAYNAPARVAERLATLDSSRGPGGLGHGRVGVPRRARSFGIERPSGAPCGRETVEQVRT